jgi:signal transduction histidine kinase
MSLHGKIVSWFAFFAALTVLLFGLGDYIQSTRSLRFALEGNVRSMALQAALEMERRYEAFHADLVAVASAASVEELDTIAFPGISRFSTIRVDAGRRRVLELNGRPAEHEPDACDADYVHFSFDFPGTSGGRIAVEATMPTSVFFSEVAFTRERVGEGGITAVYSLEDGGVIHDTGCGLRNAEPALAADVRTAVSTLNQPDAPVVRLFELQGQRSQPLLAGMASAARTGWGIVVLVDQSEVSAPFLSARVRYVALMALVILVAALIVLRGIRNDLSRLTAIARAADEIGRGRFDVWLPPPTADEVGRVSLALGRMVERLSASIRQIEVTRSMAAVGELSAYLSHEIRNPLSSIRLNLQMLRRDIAKGQVPEDGDQIVDLCLAELRRLDGVVKTVLQVARGEEVAAMGTSDANAAVRETLGIMRRQIEQQKVRLDVRLADGPTDVAMDAAALRGILMNLVLNSIHALADTKRPRISITTERTSDASGGMWIALTVRDNGPGVPPHLRERIFDPFFTTKATGNGIGLPTALRAAQACGGVLRYTPIAESAGAQFVLELPVSDGRRGDPATGVGSKLQDHHHGQRDTSLAAIEE